MPRITKRIVDNADATEKTHFIWDSELRGFGLRVTPNLVRTYIVQYRSRDGRSRRLTIGRHGVFTPDTARKEAQQILAEVARGSDPASERSNRRKAPTVNEVADRYFKDYVQLHNKPRTIEEYGRILERQIKPQIGSLKVASVSRADISKLHQSLASTPRQANHVIAVVSKMMNVAESWGLREDSSNPCRLIRRYPENVRDRFLSELELERLGAELEDSEVKQLTLPGAILCIRLLALTGCRLSEICTLRWEYVDLEAGALFLPDTKTGARAHVIGKEAIKLLEETPIQDRVKWVVTGNDPEEALSVGTVQKAWAKIRERAGINDVRMHDLRHTVGTYAGQTGANAFLIRDKLGHRTIAMTSRYVSRDIVPLRRLSDEIEERVAAAMKRSRESVAM